jgi:hypothetical protein
MAALTHGLIRTAHAVRCLTATANPEDLALTELARGLAYWAARYRQLPGEAALTGNHTVAEAVARLSRTSPEGARQSGRSPLADLPNNPGYAQALRALSPLAAGRRLCEMTSTFAGVYIAQPDGPPVPMIHGVTAPAAMRIALAQLPDELHAPSVAGMWRVHVALLLIFTHDADAERDILKTAATTGLLSWHDLFGRALVHGDEHVIKFTEACYRENALQPDPRFAAAVQAALQRIPHRALGGGAAIVGSRAR